MMKIQFKKYSYQIDAVNAVVECFKGQPYQSGLQYRVDPGVVKKGQMTTQQYQADDGFRNAELKLNDQEMLENIHEVQRHANLTLSKSLVKAPQAPVNLDVEMETGTGKTYVYIRTIFELNRRYGWNKFIIMVPSVAIREGIKKSFEITKEHFAEEFHKSAKFFIYDSGQLNNIESFSTDNGINVMIMNVQAFNAKGKNNRRIYEVLDGFQSRRPIDVIKANHPILILDEPQKMEGKKTQEALKEFNAMAIIRYSATHKTEHNLIHRLDAIDAYNQKLVKKISVRGINVKGLEGTHSYLYLEGIDVSKNAPVARLSLEKKLSSGGIKRETVKVTKGDNLYAKSNEMAQYKDRYLVTNIDASLGKVEFENGTVIEIGEALGDVSEKDMRRIQIRESIRAHFDKEATLYAQNIKALSLFFIDEVVKYRDYDREDTKGEYARIFEEEYKSIRDDYLSMLPLSDAEEQYHEYLKKFLVEDVHKGYFSIDKNKKQVDPKSKGESTDPSDYDLILKDKERLLSFAEPTRFIFSHSALREGWDNPNVFTMCMLKNSDNNISRRQEVGRGLRISVNQSGERQDDPATVHDINVLDVVASESYETFVKELQIEIIKELGSRPQKVTEAYFEGKIVKNSEGVEIILSSADARAIHRYLVKNNYINDDDTIAQNYHDAKESDALADLPEALQDKASSIFILVDAVFDKRAADIFADGNKTKKNRILKHNIDRKEFLELWKRINTKAIYQVKLNTDELVAQSIQAIDKNVRIRELQYVIQQGMQNESITDGDIERQSMLQTGKAKIEKYAHVISSDVTYDLLGQVSEGTALTRGTIAQILSKISSQVFEQFAKNPEDFITQTVKQINEQKAGIIVNQITYDPISDKYELDLFTEAQFKIDPQSANGPLKKHVLEYAVTDSNIEKAFIRELENYDDVIVYAKLPGKFKIPTPVGNYNPDWAISFKEGSVKHIYFVAETKGTQSAFEIRGIEYAKIECARKFFDSINKDPNFKYDVVSSYDDLMRLLQ